MSRDPYLSSVAGKNLHPPEAFVRVKQTGSFFLGVANF
jgi:hypothetical protein